MNVRIGSESDGLRCQIHAQAFGAAGSHVARQMIISVIVIQFVVTGRAS
jgi:hypothetical protein